MFHLVEWVPLHSEKHEFLHKGRILMSILLDLSTERNILLKFGLKTCFFFHVEEQVPLLLFRKSNGGGTCSTFAFSSKNCGTSSTSTFSCENRHTYCHKPILCYFWKENEGKGFILRKYIIFVFDYDWYQHYLWRNRFHHCFFWKALLLGKTSCFAFFTFATAKKHC